MAFTIACRDRVVALKAALSEFESGNPLRLADMKEALEELDEGMVHFQELEARDAQLKQGWARLEQDRLEFEAEKASFQPPVPAQPPASRMMFSGFRHNIHMRDLEGWTIASSNPLGRACTVAELGLAGLSPGSAVLLGTRKVGGDTLLTAAVGRVEFMTEPGEDRYHNCLYWSHRRDEFWAVCSCPLARAGSGCIIPGVSSIIPSVSSQTSLSFRGIRNNFPENVRGLDGWERVLMVPFERTP